MAALNPKGAEAPYSAGDVQEGALMEFHRRFGHLNNDAVERLARIPDHRHRVVGSQASQLPDLRLRQANEEPAVHREALAS